VHHLLESPELLLAAFFPDMGAARPMGGRLFAPVVRKQFRSALGIDDTSVQTAFEKVRAAGARWHSELQPSGYLVGDTFSVADLTAAALVAPAVAPPQFPYPQPQRGHPLLAPVRAILAEFGMEEWVREMYA